MKKIVVIIMFFAALAAVKPTATNLRGQIVQNVNGHYQPAANVRVDLVTWNGAAWTSYSYALTGADGFYYFSNFPPGMRFLLLVSGHYFPKAPQTINAEPPGTYQDLPVISL
ncbi:MAG TPA: hypothetical protein VFE53_23690 [Mucilaginibacter sp.]|jgi:hypothetical protein|nr:hypothetical protein [Mucilaginibacter sp.]